MLNNSRKIVFFLFGVAFCEFLSRGVLLILLAYLILKTNFFFSPEVIFKSRFHALALISCLFPLGMFLSATPLGILSDKYGRYPLLIFSILLGLLGSLLAIVGVSSHAIYVIAGSRFVAGLGAGNISLIWAIVNNASPDRKANNVATIQLAIALGFTIGPAIGGGLIGLHDYVSPILILTLIQFGLLMLSFYMLKEGSPIVIKKRKTPYQLRGLFLLFFAWLVIMFGWVGFREFLPSALIQLYDCSSSELGEIYLYIGLVYILSTFFILRRFLKLYSVFYIVLLSLLMMAVFMELTINVKGHVILLISLFFYTACSAVAIPSLITYILSYVEDDQRGTLSGLLTSTQALMMIIATASAALIATGPAVFLSIGGVVVCAGVCFIFYHRRTRRK